MLAEALILGAMCSVDAFVASMAYGNRRIKMPIVSILIISAISSAVLGVSFWVGEVIKGFLSSWISGVLGFLVLLAIGICKLFEKNNPEKSDANGDKVISPVEAATMAIALSLDSLGVGVGASLGGSNGFWVCLFTFAIDVLAMLLGSFLGNKIALNSRYDLSWLSGIVLIILAFSKF